jgi:dolichyl-phosphate-mannose--protein O-mannosyl transferase
MPGVIPHLIAGSILYLIGRVTFRSYFEGDQKLRKNLLLAAVCLVFSLASDFFLAVYYLTHLVPVTILMSYQRFTHQYLTPLAIGLLIPILIVDRKRRPLWIMGVFALALHLAMDLIAQSLQLHYGVFI